jgi:hypothetical protein
MTTRRTFIERHPVLTYFALTFAISWGGALLVIGPGGFLGTEDVPEALFLVAVVAVAQRGHLSRPPLRPQVA